MDDKKIMNRLQEQLEEVRQVYPDNDWFGIFLQGSQNYGMADDESDIDSKCWFLPSIEQLVLNKSAISHTHVMSNNEHVDCKDIREYFKILRKQNVNFMEVLFTDYFIINPRYFDLWTDLQIHREEIARSNMYRFLKCCKGMCYEKSHALCHPYPSKMNLIEKYGYDGKQLSHAIRIYHFAVDFALLDKSYKECLTPENVDELMDIKRYNIPEMDEDAAIEAMKNAVAAMDAFEVVDNKYRKDELNPEVDKLLNEVLYKAVTRSLKEELNV